MTLEDLFCLDSRRNSSGQQTRKCQRSKRHPGIKERTTTKAPGAKHCAQGKLSWSGCVLPSTVRGLRITKVLGANILSEDAFMEITMHFSQLSSMVFCFGCVSGHLKKQPPQNHLRFGGTRGFPGLTANRHTLGPSWSVRLLAAPRSVGPAVFVAHRQPATHSKSKNCKSTSTQMSKA